MVEMQSLRHNLVDRGGIYASVFCALHCAAAPLILLAAPSFGGFWSHPIVHIAIAACVLPLAAIALRNGYRTHGKTWVAVLAVAGIVFILLGAILPYLDTTPLDAAALEPGSPGSGAGAAGAAASGPGVAAEATTKSCCDSCCPSLVVDEATGDTTLNIPPASWVTFAGGASLITAHIANIVFGKCC